jgi:PDZ domain/Aspartyl protease
MIAIASITRPTRLALALLFTTASALVWTLAGAQAPPATAKGKVATVPFEMLPSNHMVVSAKLNGKGPFRLVFDLGAPITLLSNKASEAAGIVDKNARRSLLFAMRGESEVNSLQVGDLTAKKLPVIVLDHPALRALGGLLGKPLDGIIGFTFFARYKTTIDYQSKTMTFEPVDYEVRNLMKDLPERMAGPKEARRRFLSPGAYFGLSVGDPVGGLDAPGVPIVYVAKDSPAASAGLKLGDVLTGMDGRWITSITDAYAAAAGTSPEKAVALDILRNGKPLSLSITPRAGL